MESTERDASGPMALWEFASHIRTTTVMDTTTVRLVVPTDPTERGASDHMGLRSSAGRISGKNSRAVASREPKLGKERAVVAVRMSGLIGAADQPGPRSSSRSTSVPSYGRYGRSWAAPRGVGGHLGLAPWRLNWLYFRKASH
jgi:hypothetical protein